MKTRLSVNINKVALIRNARGADYPNLLAFAQDCERFGAEGITVHPRPDERHVRLSDCSVLKPHLSTEFNIEGYPSRQFLEMIAEVRPHQCTLVPDPPEALTSSEGWNTLKEGEFLIEVLAELKQLGVRSSLFMETNAQLIEEAAKLGADRIEFYTGNYAQDYQSNPEKAIEPFVEAAKIAESCGLGINAGHDLNLKNLNFFVSKVSNVAEVSIGHALICDSLYYGLENTIQLYLRELDPPQ